MAGWLDISDKAVKVAVGVVGLVMGKSRIDAAKDIMGVLTDGRDLLADLSEPERDLANALRDGAVTHFEALARQPDFAAGRLETARIHMEQALPLCLPSKDRIAALGADPSPIAEAMADAAVAAQPDWEFAVHFRSSDPEMAYSRKFFIAAATPVLDRLLNDPQVVETLVPALWRGINRKLDALPDATADALLRKLDERGELQKAGARGLELAVVQLAKRTSRRVEDFEQAFLELERAVEIAIDVQEAGERGSNLGDFVDDVLRRVAERMRAGDQEGAAEAVEAGLADWRSRQEEMTAQGLRLLEAALAQDLLRGDAEAAAARIAARLDLETGPAPRFERLRAVWEEWFVRGRDRGVNLDLAVSIHIAHLCIKKAEGQDQRGIAQNDVGISLATLGERETGTDRLNKAVAAYRSALEERTRERVPLDWAMTQNNLGNALLTLGERESGTTRLEEAVTAYRSALEDWTRERVPLDWAATQNNLGNALQTLGEREGGTARLEEAVAAYRSALEEWTRKRVPLDWAMTQNNLGNALQTLGQRESGTARLEEAVAAYRNALEEWTRERVPLQRAMTQNNLGGVETAFFDKTADPAHLARAAAHVQAALEVYREAGATHYIGMAEENLAGIAARRMRPA